MHLEWTRRLTKPTRRSRRILGLSAEFPGVDVLASTLFREVSTPIEALNLLSLAIRCIDQREVQRLQPANGPRLETSSYKNRTESWVMQTALPKQISRSTSVMPRQKKNNAPQGGHLIQATEQSSQNKSGNGAPQSTSNADETQVTAGTKTTKDIDWMQTLLEGINEGTEKVHLYTNEKDLKLWGKAKPGLTNNSKEMISQLKEETREHEDRRYKERSLAAKLSRLPTKREPAVVHELQDLVCPAAESLADMEIDDDDLLGKYCWLADAWGEAWNKNVPKLAKSPPQPDYCVGYSRNAFSADQRKTLEENTTATTTFTPTKLMCFPFLTCEAKAKEVMHKAQGQNCWSMFIAVRATVKLFRMTNMQHEINREILAFSVAYNYEVVVIHAYYPILDGETTKIYRQLIHNEPLEPQLTPKDPWKAYDLVRNVYENWAQKHLDRLHKAIDAIAAISQETESSSSTVIAEEPPALPSSASGTARRQDQPHETEPSSKKRGRADQHSGEPSKKKFNLRSNKTAKEPAQEATQIASSTGLSFGMSTVGVSEGID